MADIQYKTPKNPDRPGRPPAGCKWVRDAKGDIAKNSKGQLGYQKLTASELAAAGKKKKKRKTRGSKKAAAPAAVDTRSIMIRKGSYGNLSFDDLIKIQGWVTAAIDRRKAAEKSSVASQIKELEAKLKSLG